MIPKKITTTLVLSAVLLGQACNVNRPTSEVRRSPGSEVIYHVVQRSFYDSNGDLHGDLKGLTEKLDYLQDLGITSILLLPLYQSVFYHNYFAGNFEKIDPKFGSMEDYLTLVKSVHQRGMKIYMDMETQYVTEDHLWYKDAYQNPKSEYSDYLVFNGPGNTKPEPIVYNLDKLEGYNKTVRKITTVNLNSKKVLEYNYTLFHHWMDPNHDGKFDDGVDGFRLDHMMDDLDLKGKFKDLFTKFWSPMISRLKQINPQLIIIAEQANWGSFGAEYFAKGGVDRVFAFRLMMAIATFNKNKIALMADSTFLLTPKNKQQIVFLENHDTKRFSSAVSQDPGKLRVGAALNLLLGGIPAIYYGQELGMTGSGGFGKFGNSDGNDIPQREAFRWYKEVEGKGMALWYKDTGPWWDQTSLKSNDGVSLEEQQNDPSSLWNFYKKMIAFRESQPLLISGAYQTLKNDNDNVLSFLRYENDQGIVVVVNLSDANQTVNVDLSRIKVSPDTGSDQLWGDAKATVSANILSTDLKGYGIAVWRMR